MEGRGSENWLTPRVIPNTVTGIGNWNSLFLDLADCDIFILFIIYYYYFLFTLLRVVHVRSVLWLGYGGFWDGSRKVGQIFQLLSFYGPGLLGCRWQGTTPCSQTTSAPEDLKQSFDDTLENPMWVCSKGVTWVVYLFICCYFALYSFVDIGLPPFPIFSPSLSPTPRCSQYFTITQSFTCSLDSNILSVCISWHCRHKQSYRSRYAVF